MQIQKNNQVNKKRKEKLKKKKGKSYSASFGNFCI